MQQFHLAGALGCHIAANCCRLDLWKAESTANSHACPHTTLQTLQVLSLHKLLLLCHVQTYTCCCKTQHLPVICITWLAVNNHWTELLGIDNWPHFYALWFACLWVLSALWFAYLQVLSNIDLLPYLLLWCLFDYIGLVTTYFCSKFSAYMQAIIM